MSSLTIDAAAIDLYRCAGCGQSMTLTATDDPPRVYPCYVEKAYCPASGEPMQVRRFVAADEVRP